MKPAIKIQDSPVCELQKSKSSNAPMQGLCVVIFAVHISNAGPDKVVINKDIHKLHERRNNKINIDFVISALM